jgi:hypothetical protein
MRIGEPFDMLVENAEIENNMKIYSKKKENVNYEVKN